MSKQSRRVARDRNEVRLRIDAVTDASHRAVQRLAQLGPTALPWADGEYRELATKARDAGTALFGWLHSLRDGMTAGDGAAFDQAFAFLELDVYLFRSGYERAKLVRALAKAPMTPQQRMRARTYVRDCIDGGLHCDLRALAMLAAAVADNPLRRDLLARLHAPDAKVVGRAVQLLCRVRHPGYSTQDLAAVRSWVLSEVAERGASNVADRVLRWAWTPEWEAELNEIGNRHGPQRAAALTLLDLTNRRRTKRPGP
ncbi:MAG: hypothetical protein ACKVWR_18340 [Acidimicrobiales bacterium]